MNRAIITIKDNSVCVSYENFPNVTPKCYIFTEEIVEKMVDTLEMMGYTIAIYFDD